MPTGDIKRIVILTLDSFYSNGAVSKLIDHYGDRISLIVLSQRYGGKHGTFIHQLIKNFKNSGFRFVIYLSYHLITYHIFNYLFIIINLMLFRKSKIFPIKKLAKRYGIPVLKTHDINSDSVEEEIKRVNPDLLVASYFDQIIKRKVYNIPSRGTINIHPGLLPLNKGVFPPLAAVVHNHPQGVTVHYINDFLDEGEIIKEKTAELKKGESILIFDNRVMKEGAELVIKVIGDMEKNICSSTPQEHGAGNYYSFPTKPDIQRVSSARTRLFSFLGYIKTYL